MTPSGDRIRAHCDVFRRAWRARLRRPDVERPAMTRPRPPKAPDLSRIGKMVTSKGKGIDPPPGMARPRGATWNRFHGGWEFKIKVHQHSFHLGYFRGEDWVIGARKFDRVAFRVWGEGARSKLNYPDHEQLARIEVDGVPADPFSSEEERA